MTKLIFITTARNKKGAAAAKRHYTRRGIPVEVREREDGTFTLFTDPVFSAQAHAVRSGRAAL